MNTTKTRLGLVAVVGLGLMGVVAGRARTAGQATGDQEHERLMAKGKAIFVEKCAKCHNERGDKALSSGVPLSERGLATDVIARAVKGRLGSGTEEEKQAVTLYIASLMKTADKAAPKP
jgi:mono/diheme cytochrome c family protein